MARTRDQLTAWALLLEVCEDDCTMLALSPALRASVLEVERELKRLHQVEDCAINLARLFKALRDADKDDGAWDDAIEDVFALNEPLCLKIEALVPEAFTPEAMAPPAPCGSSPRQTDNGEQP